MNHQTISCRRQPSLNKSLHCRRARIHSRSIHKCRRTLEVRKPIRRLLATPNHTAGNAGWNRRCGGAEVTLFIRSRSCENTSYCRGTGLGASADEAQPEPCLCGRTIKLTGPAATPAAERDAQGATGNRQRGRVRCSAWFGVSLPRSQQHPPVAGVTYSATRT